jgi:hypothetical protein
MKKIAFLLGLPVLFLALAAFKMGKKVNLETKSLGPLITANVVAATDCRVGNNCSKWHWSIKKYHGFKITLTGASISYYQSNMVYSVYKVDPYSTTNPTALATFPCTKNIVEFNASSLPNNTQIWVIIKAANSNSSGMVTFTTGMGAGSSCVVASPGSATQKKN